MAKGAFESEDCQRVSREKNGKKEGETKRLGKNFWALNNMYPDSERIETVKKEINSMKASLINK
jgi:hypothetical protein